MVALTGFFFRGTHYLHEAVCSRFVLIYEGGMTRENPVHRQYRRADATDLDRMVQGGFNLEVYCKACSRTIVIDPLPLLRLAVLKRWPRDIIRMGKHLRCRCGWNDPALRAFDGPATAPDIGITSEAQFEALKKRLR